MNTQLLDHPAQYIRPVPKGFMQAVAFEYKKSILDDRGKPASTTFKQTVEIIFLSNKQGRNKYCVTCIEAALTDVRQSNPLQKLELLIREIFDLVVLTTNQKGFIHKINNYDYLKLQWQIYRVEILQDHDGEEHLQLVWNMDALMDHEQKIIAFLQLPSNYGLFFNGYKNINIAVSDQTNSVFFGEELSNKIVKEVLNWKVTHTETQQLVELLATSSDEKEEIHYTASCVYLDGALDTCFKEIKTEFFTLNYSAKWVGLKKSFLH